MINVKEHVKLTGLYTFFAAFPAVLQLIVYPIIEGTDKLGAEDFGYLAVAEALLSFMVMFCLYGMAITIARFYFEVKDDKQGYHRMVSTILTGVLLRGIIVLGAAVVFADFFGSFFSSPELQKFKEYGHYLAIIALNRTIIMVALTLYRNEKKVRLFVIVSLLSGIARSALQVVGVVYYDLSFVGYLAGTALGGGMAAMLIVIYTYSRSGFQYSRAVVNHLRKYAFPLFIADIVLWGIMFIDRFLLMNDPELLGIYDNALKFAIGIQFFSQGLASYVQPELYRLFEQGSAQNGDGIRSQSNLFMAENIAMVITLLIPVMWFVNYFYETNLALSAGILALVFAKFILYAQYQIFLWPIFFMKRTTVFLYINIMVLIVVVIINILLIPRFGYYGAIAASLAGGAIQVAAFHIIQQRLMPIRWNRTKLIWFPFALILMIIFTEFLKQSMGMGAFTSAFLVVIFGYAGLALMYRKELHGILKKHIFRHFL
jgi:O-antigen/teichoic acid export membrane protein